jgi:hypothetical protein
MSNEKETTIPHAQRGPAAGRRGPQIVTKLQNTRQKDEFRICSNATEVSSKNTFGQASLMNKKTSKTHKLSPCVQVSSLATQPHRKSL